MVGRILKAPNSLRGIIWERGIGGTSRTGGTCGAATLGNGLEHRAVHRVASIGAAIVALSRFGEGHARAEHPSQVSEARISGHLPDIKVTVILALHSRMAGPWTKCQSSADEESCSSEGSWVCKEQACLSTSLSSPARPRGAGCSHTPEHQDWKGVGNWRSSSQCSSLWFLPLCGCAFPFSLPALLCTLSSS